MGSPERPRVSRTRWADAGNGADSVWRRANTVDTKRSGEGKYKGINPILRDHRWKAQRSW
jgi:hypothetical protein